MCWKQSVHHQPAINTISPRGFKGNEERLRFQLHISFTLNDHNMTDGFLVSFGHKIFNSAPVTEGDCRGFMKDLFGNYIKT